MMNNHAYVARVLASEMGDNSNFGEIGGCQWSSVDDKKFLPAGKVFPFIPAGVYEPKLCPNLGFHFEKIEFKTENLIEFPETSCEKILCEIQKFWSKKDRFNNCNLVHKFGIMIYGPPGSGKSSTIKLVLKDNLARGGVAMKFGNPTIFLQCLRIFRNIQPETPIVVLMEDLDSILDEYGETEILNLLDGVETFSNIVYLATTNYPENLGKRMMNRPGRFDLRFKMPHPGVKSRRLYFENLLKQDNFSAEVDLDKWVKDTEGMSIAHLKALFEGVCIFENPYEEVLEALVAMEDIPSSEEDRTNHMGFHSNRPRYVTR